jgi:hypothetical protein
MAGVPVMSRVLAVHHPLMAVLRRRSDLIRNRLGRRAARWRVDRIVVMGCGVCVMRRVAVLQSCCLFQARPGLGRSYRSSGAFCSDAEEIQDGRRRLCQLEGVRATPDEGLPRATNIRHRE